MLKTRIIPCLTIKDLKLVKSIKFAEHRNIGSYIAAVRVFNARDVDEMIFLDLDARLNGLKPWLLTEVAKECFMPLAVGGGIRTLNDIHLLLQIGADKVVINTAVVENPSFIGEAARVFGSQCIVVSIDAKKTGKHHEVFSHGGSLPTGRTPASWAAEAERQGAGEIFLTSIDRDGTMEGYDTALVKEVSTAVNIPVIACGGAGKGEDFEQAIKEGGASAAAAASIFQYTQITPLAIKRRLAALEIPVRI